MRLNCVNIKYKNNPWSKYILKLMCPSSKQGFFISIPNILFHKAIKVKDIEMNII